MNFMYTARCPKQIALEHCNVHRNSQIREHCQMLSTAHNVTKSGLLGVYETTHQFHPTSVWVRKSTEHYKFLWETTRYLCDLFVDYDGSDHGCEPILERLKAIPPRLQDNGFTEPPAAVGDRFKPLVKANDVKFAYQRYLNWKFRGWVRRDRVINPQFITRHAWFVPSKVWLRINNE